MSKKNDYPYREIISANIREQLKKLSMSRRELAEKLDVSLSLVNYWCTGERVPYIDKIYAMADIFGVEGGDLMFSRTGNEKEVLSLYRNADEEVQGVVLHYLKDNVKRVLA